MGELLAFEMRVKVYVSGSDVGDLWGCSAGCVVYFADLNT